MYKADPFLESIVFAIQKRLGSEVQFICLYGSRARQESNPDSDADIMVATKGPVNSDLLRLLFKDIRLIYLEYGCLFDEDYPVEVVSTFDLKLALDGYGHVEENGVIVTNSIGPLDWSGFNSHRQWLAALAIPNVFLAGDENIYNESLKKAHMTMLRIALLASADNTLRADFLADYIISWGKEVFGFSESAYTRAYINNHYAPLLSTMSQEGVIEEDGVIRIIDRQYLMPRGVKDVSRYDTEQEYLGVHDTAATIQEHYRGIQNATQQFINQPMLSYMSVPDLVSLSKKMGIESDSTSSDEAIKLLLRYSIRQNHPRYAAFPDAGNSKSALFAAALEPILNQNMIAVDKSAPIGTFMEVDLIRTLRKLVAYEDTSALSAPELGGVATAGGTTANATALLVARTKAFPTSRISGLASQASKGYLLISGDTLEHYSHKASFWWLGLGEENVIAVESKNYHFDLIDLEEKLRKYNSNGNKVIAVVALAGDSRTTTIQNIRQIHKLTESFGTWLHVDACHGGIGLFSSQRDILCADYNLADSIAIDPHKGLAIPYSSSFCLFKSPDDLAAIAKSTDITIAKGSFDLGQITPFAGSRPFDSFKLWYEIKNRGLEKIAKDIDYRIELTKIWHQLIIKSKYLTALHEPTLTALSFTVSPKKLGISLDQVSRVNRMIHDRAYREGWFIIHCFELIDYGEVLEMGKSNRFTSLGVNFGNIQLDTPMLEVCLDYLDTLIEDTVSTLNRIDQKEGIIV